jgi:hypothetical protein
MDRRELLGALGATAAGLLIASGHEVRAQHEHAGHHHNPMHEDCLKACQGCAKACDEAFHHCTTQVAEGKKEHAKALQYVADCAKFCDLSAGMVARHSPLMAHACAACAEACKDCAAECEKLDSQPMRDCVAACRACEKSCREMVKATGATYYCPMHEGVTSNSPARCPHCGMAMKRR